MVLRLMAAVPAVAVAVGASAKHGKFLFLFCGLKWLHLMDLRHVRHERKEKWLWFPKNHSE